MVTGRHVELVAAHRTPVLRTQSFEQALVTVEGIQAARAILGQGARGGCGKGLVQPSFCYERQWRGSVPHARVKASAKAYLEGAADLPAMVASRRCRSRGGLSHGHAPPAWVRQGRGVGPPERRGEIRTRGCGRTGPHS